LIEASKKKVQGANQNGLVWLCDDVDETLFWVLAAFGFLAVLDSASGGSVVGRRSTRKKIELSSK
jgi:hypothetical protein